MSRHPFDNLLNRLHERGVPADYLDRLELELADHYESLRADYVGSGLGDVEAASLAAAQIGDEDVLYQQILSRRHAIPLVRRYPTISFTVGPVSALIVSAVIFGLFGCGLFLTARRVFGVPNTDPLLRELALGVFKTFVYVLTPALSLVFCRLAWRHGLSYVRPLLACVVLCVVGGFFEIYFVLCPVSGNVKFFYWMGLDAARLSAPLAVFVVHALVCRAIQAWRARPTSCA